MLQRAVAMSLFLISACASATAGSLPSRGTAAAPPPPFDHPLGYAPAPQWTSGDQYWADQFALPQVDGVVQCALEYRGTLIIGGTFHQVGDVPAENIAVWDGASWSELGGGTSGPVYALQSYEGDLIAGGAFYRAGTQPTRDIARWNGADWAPMGLGLEDGGQYYDPSSGYYYYEPSAVRALAVYQGALIAGGSFARSGPFQLPSLARWEGSAWIPIASRIEGPVHALAVSGDTLYAGGQISSVGYEPTPAIARWDGERWSAMGSGLTISTGYGVADVRALLAYQGRVIAGGSFGAYGSTGVAAWNGASWDSMIVSGAYGVRSLAARDDTLLIGGDFGFTTWPADPYEPSPIDGSVYGLAWYGSNLLAVGSLNVRAEWTDSLVAVSLAVRRPGGWTGLIPWTDRMHGLGDGSNIGRVTALEVYRDQLVALGDFRFAGDPPRWTSVSSIATWDGAAWRPLPPMTGLCGWSLRGPLQSDGDTLYVAGQFYSCATNQILPVMRFDGVAWAPLDSLPIVVNAMALYGGSLHVAGDRIDEYPGRSEVYRWSGDHWVRIGFAGGYNGTSIRAMTVYGGRLIVGGRFDGVNNQLAGSVAAWDGTRWEALGSIPTEFYLGRDVTSLATHRGFLVAAVYQGWGRSVYSWNGATWEPLASLTAIGNALASIGGELYLGGQVARNQPTYDGVARWNGRAWEQLGSGTNGTVRALREWRGSLWVGGEFTRAGSHAAFAIARWDGVRATLGAPRVALAAVAPNPFRAAAAIKFGLLTAGNVQLSVVDVRGRRVRVLERAWRDAGEHVTTWDGRDDNGRPAASGVYYVRIQMSDGPTASQKMVLLR